VDLIASSQSVQCCHLPRLLHRGPAVAERLSQFFLPNFQAETVPICQRQPRSETTEHDLVANLSYHVLSGIGTTPPSVLYLDVNERLAAVTQSVRVGNALYRYRPSLVVQLTGLSKQEPTGDRFRCFGYCKKVRLALPLTFPCRQI